MTHVLTQLQLLFFSALAFVWLNLQRLYPPELPSTNLDADWLYRKLAPTLVKRVAGKVYGRYESFEKSIVMSIKQVIHNSYDTKLGQPKGYFARLWPIETMVVWVAVLLFIYLILYYVHDLL
jgi:multicomponent Na+:H+ antiporter subunit D